MLRKTLLKNLLLAVVVVLATHCNEEDAFYSNVLRSDVFYQTRNDSKYDFLFVMDNSASMSTRNSIVNQNMNAFVNVLNSRKAIDFQLAITDVDFISHHGNLITTPGGLQVIKSATSANVVNDFSALVGSITDSLTSFWEQGLESAYQALKNSGSIFMRDGVPLVIVFITDEDDYSCQSGCTGIEPEDNSGFVAYDTARYTSYFESIKAPQNTDVYLFPVVGINYTNCPLATVGTRYIDVAQTVGGLSASGSICDADLPNSFQNIARVIADLGTVFALSNHSTGINMRVFVDSVEVPNTPDNFVFDQPSNSLIFKNYVPKTGSIIEVTYNQS